MHTRRHKGRPQLSIQLYVSKCDILCSGQQKLRSVWLWKHYNKSTGGLYCRMVTMEMIDSRRHFKALQQPHKLRLDPNTTAPPGTKTQIPIRENGFDFTNGLFVGAFMGLMFSLSTHTAFFAPSPAHIHLYVNIHRHPHTSRDLFFLQTKQYELSACGEGNVT